MSEKNCLHEVSDTNNHRIQRFLPGDLTGREKGRRVGRGYGSHYLGLFVGSVIVIISMCVKETMKQ